jgi:hypothetical protein
LRSLIACRWCLQAVGSSKPLALPSGTVVLQQLSSPQWRPWCATVRPSAVPRLVAGTHDLRRCQDTMQHVPFHVSPSMQQAVPKFSKETSAELLQHLLHCCTFITQVHVLISRSLPVKNKCSRVYVCCLTYPGRTVVLHTQIEPLQANPFPPASAPSNVLSSSHRY